ncbi:hypothetical protein [Xylophilus ampelinus]|nr:hypothetical protein [Xylophilus ampelinus]MCS4510855.1 hypothetical protein [Xylophilus ampelinus]
MPARHLLLRGVACAAIGAAILVAPPYMRSEELRAAVEGSAMVGWLAIAIGIVLAGCGAYKSRTSIRKR